MLHDAGQLHAADFSEDVLADIESMPEFDDEREKDGAVKAFTVARSVPGFPLRAVA